MNEPLLELIDIHKSYNPGQENQIEVLRGANLSVDKGEIVGLLAPSGAGKSTLLHIAGLLDQPDAGNVILDGADMGRARDVKRTVARREKIGFVYQFHHLLPEFSAAENLMLPMRANGIKKGECKIRASELLRAVGLEARADHRPSELSGGEQQRIAVCRALSNAPQLLLADEPTGNLDPKTSHKVFRILLYLVRETRLSALIATHNLELASSMDRLVRLEDGVLVEA